MRVRSSLSVWTMLRSSGKRLSFLPPPPFFFFCCLTIPSLATMG